MKLGFGLMFFAACSMGLTGCANWQNRVGTAGAPGTAAGSMTVPPAPLGSDPMMAAPGSTFGAPPPPTAPPPNSDPFLTLPPADNAPAQRLDLSATGSAPAPSSSAPAPSRMYNLESSTPKPKTASTSTSSKPRNSTINKLASKSDSSSASTSKKTADAPAKPKASGSSTLAKLSRSSSTDSEPKPSPTSLPKPEAAAAPPQPAQSESDPMMDTSFLAQPVRKGADAGSSESDSKGPQSNLLNTRGSSPNRTLKPVIYPVSNPAVDEPVDVTQFT